MCIYHCCGLLNCGDVATDLLPTMPPDCSQNKPGSTVRLRYGILCSGDQHQVSSLQQKSDWARTSAPRACWPARLSGSSDLSAAGLFFWLRLMVKDRHSVCATFGQTSTAQIENTPNVFSCSCVRPHLWGGAVQLRLWYNGVGKLGGGAWGLLPLLLVRYCSSLLLRFWKHQCWELSRVWVLNICPSLQHQNIIMQICALFIGMLFKWIQTLSQVFEYLKRNFGENKELCSQAPATYPKSITNIH